VDIAIRVDASAAIGLGHFKRCAALAEELRALGTRVVFVVRRLGVDVEAQLTSSDFRSVALPIPDGAYPETIGNDRLLDGWAGVAWLFDAQQTVDALASFAPDWVIVDHYSFDARWHEYVSARLGTRIAVIDDLADRPVFASILIDHNLSKNHERRYAGLLRTRAKLLVGPRFALLAPAFRDAEKYKFRDSALSVGIFMGGVDRDNLSCKALRACRETAKLESKIEVVSTRFNPHIEELKVLAAQWPPTIVSEDLPNLAAFFARHDLQIGAGGGATWERAIAGVPSLLLVAAENQRAGVRELRDIGAIATLGEIESSSIDAIGAVVLRLINDAGERRSLADKSKLLVDGLGTRRVALCLLRTELAVRRAEISDTALMFNWRNDPRTRVVSRNTEQIDPQSHASWVDRTLADPNRCLLIGSIGGLGVGVVRFDRLNDDETEVSLYLDPELHGLGLGASLLSAGEGFLATLGGHVFRIIASVREENLASQRLFESCGYCYRLQRWEKTIEVHEDDRDKDC
jgi:UDP-2,4-diacetamido-2,4,6-trideoxy-beta-L-altropyranose hydrolase